MNLKISLCLILLCLTINLHSQLFVNSANYTVSGESCFDLIDYSESKITVDGIGVLSDSVYLDFIGADMFHNRDIFELSLKLKSPEGTVINILKEQGDGKHMTNTFYSDTSNLDIDNGISPYSDFFKPVEPLSSFDGESADGEWTLLACACCNPFGSIKSFTLGFYNNSDSCQFPFNLRTTNISNESVDVDWTTRGNPQEFNYEICPTGTPIGDVNCQQFNTSIIPKPISISGLETSTEYDLYLWETCNSGFTDTIQQTFETLLCELPIVSYTVVQDCSDPVNQSYLEFTVEVHISSMGEGSSLIINPSELGVASISVLDTGTYTFSGFPFFNSTGIIIEHSISSDCDLDLGIIRTDYNCLGCGNKFYDTGGPADWIEPGEEGEWIICPDDSVNVVSLIFNEFQMLAFDEFCLDGIEIYDGKDTTALRMHSDQGYCKTGIDGTEYPGGALGNQVTATNPSGCLFVRMNPAIDIRGEESNGWEADINCIPRNPQPIQLLGTTSSSILPVSQIGIWTYYGSIGNNYFAINKYPIGGNSTYFDPEVNINIDTAFTSVDDAQFQTNTSLRYWNVNLSRGNLNGFVNIRFYYNQAENLTLESASSNFAGTGGIDYGLEWFKTVGSNFDPATDVLASGINTGISLIPVEVGVENGVDYVTLQVSSFSGGGAKSSAMKGRLPLNKFKVNAFYPSPVYNFLNMELESLNGGNVKLNLFGFLGNELWSREIDLEQGIIIESIQLNDLEAGIYFLKMVHDGVSIVKRIVKK